MAISRWRSTSHRFWASIWSCTFACSARSFSISASLMGSANLALISFQRLTTFIFSPTPS